MSSCLYEKTYVLVFPACNYKKDINVGIIHDQQRDKYIIPVGALNTVLCSVWETERYISDK